MFKQTRIIPEGLHFFPKFFEFETLAMNGAPPVSLDGIDVFSCGVADVVGEAVLRIG